MNIEHYGKGHNFKHIGSVFSIFNRYIYQNCKLNISQRIDNETIYGITYSPDNIREMNVLYKTWENLSCDEIIIKNIIE